MQNSWNIDFLSFEINIHKEKASQVLTLNRNKINPEYEDELIKQFFTTSYKIIIDNFDSIFITPQLKSVGSMYLHFYHKYYDLKKYDITRFNQWQDFEININDQIITLKKLLDLIDKFKLIYERKIPSLYNDQYKLNGKELEIILRGGHPSFDYTKFLLFKIQEEFSSFCKTNASNAENEEIIFTKEMQASPIKINELPFIIESLKNKYPYSARAIIPCVEEYFILRLRKEAHISYVRNYMFDSNVYIPYPKMLSPYVRELKKDEKIELKEVLNEKLFEWVFQNRYDINTTKEQIIEGYKSFCKSIDLGKINKASTDSF